MFSLCPQKFEVYLGRWTQQSWAWIHEVAHIYWFKIMQPFHYTFLEIYHYVEGFFDSSCFSHFSPKSSCIFQIKYNSSNWWCFYCSHYWGPTVLAVMREYKQLYSSFHFDPKIHPNLNIFLHPYHRLVYFPLLSLHRTDPLELQSDLLMSFIIHCISSLHNTFIFIFPASHGAVC